MIMINKEVQNLVGIIKQIVENNMFPKEWRVGQAVFNLCYMFLPNETDKLRGTDVDCFHNDNKVEIFIDSLLKQFDYEVNEENLNQFLAEEFGSAFFHVGSDDIDDEYGVKLEELILIQLLYKYPQVLKYKNLNWFIKHFIG